MSTPVIINGVTYNIPAYNEVGWAQGSGNLSSFLVVVGNIASSVRLIGTNTSSTIVSSSGISSTGGGQYFDITNITIGAGVWAISGNVGFNFGAASTVTQVLGAVGTNAGNTGVGLSLGDNMLSGSLPTSAIDSSATVANWIKSVSVNTLIYLKAYMQYTGSAPIAYGRIIAVQIG
jgi:hypothetical protein